MKQVPYARAWACVYVVYVHAELRVKHAPMNNSVFIREQRGSRKGNLCRGIMDHFLAHSLSLSFLFLPLFSLPPSPFHISPLSFPSPSLSPSLSPLFPSVSPSLPFLSWESDQLIPILRLHQGRGALGDLRGYRGKPREYQGNLGKPKGILRED